MKTTPNDSKNKDLNGLKHQMEYLNFVTWVATPNALRDPKTQQELSKEFGVGQDTLSEWKARPGFWKSVIEKRKHWGQERTPNVIMAIYDKIIKTGNAPEVKLWLQYIENWSESVISTTPLKRKYQHLTNAELMDHQKKLRDFLLKR